MLLHNKLESACPRASTAKNVSPLPRIVMSSRVRLARNLQGERFPNWASKGERLALLQRIGSAVLQAVEDDEATLIEIEKSDARERDLLVERWLISRDLAEGGPGGGVIICRKGNVSIMINEEDHIRIQAITPGLDLAEGLRVADTIDSRLERLLPYAYSQRLGYLTACPSNVGTGMRASVMVHLPGLRLTGEIDPVLQGLERLRFAVRGISGEGSAAAGHRFQISNQGTLGLTEEAVIASLERVATEVARHEKQARLRALRDSPTVLEDCLARSLAMLQQARLIQAEEALDYLSAVRMGVEMELIRKIPTDKLDVLELAVQPGHLQEFLKADLDADMRDMRRADTLNEMLYGCEVNGRRIRADSKRLTRQREST